MLRNRNGTIGSWSIIAPRWPTLLGRLSVCLKTDSSSRSGRFVIKIANLFVTESVWWSLSRWTNKVGAGRVANRLLDGDLLDAIVKCDKSWDILDIIGCCADGGAAFRQGLLMIITYYRVEFLKETNILLSEIDIVIVFYGKREVQYRFRVLQSCSKWNLCITRGEIKMQRQKLGFLWSKIRENGNVENVSKIIKLSRRINRRDEDAF